MGTVEIAEDLRELALFLAEINKDKKSHIGFCGENPEEIYRTLQEDIIGDDGETTFLIARNNAGKIVAAIGLDIDETIAEVWGPFNQTTSIGLQSELWKQLLAVNPTIKTFQFFINKENTQQQKFMNEIKAKNKGEHLNLEMNKQDFKKVHEMKSRPFVQSDFQAFEILHNTTFPNTYYDAKTISKRLSDENVLRLLKTESDELQGYVYFEVDQEAEEAHLEYIGVSEEFQNMGLGTLLLKEALSEMFSFPQINEITLTVENTNSQANHVYEKVGFKSKDVLIYYVLHL